MVERGSDEPIPVTASAHWQVEQRRNEEASTETPRVMSAVVVQCDRPSRQRRRGLAPADLRWRRGWLAGLTGPISHLPIRSCHGARSSLLTDRRGHHPLVRSSSHSPTTRLTTEADEHWLDFSLRRVAPALIGWQHALPPQTQDCPWRRAALASPTKEAGISYQRYRAGLVYKFVGTPYSYTRLFYDLRRWRRR